MGIRSFFSYFAIPAGISEEQFAGGGIIFVVVVVSGARWCGCPHGINDEFVEESHTYTHTHTHTHTHTYMELSNYEVVCCSKKHSVYTHFIWTHIHTHAHSKKSRNSNYVCVSSVCMCVFVYLSLVCVRVCEASVRCCKVNSSVTVERGYTSVGLIANNII